MLNESLHTEIEIKKGEFLVRNGQQNYRIGQCLKGVLRGFTQNTQEEVCCHFFLENDLVSGNYIPNIPAILDVQALENCIISVANYNEIFSLVNTDKELTNIILDNFQKLNKQINSRIETLITGNALTKYKWFLSEYPNLLNRIPHYYIASFLGITPTQLSRTRKTLSQQM